MIKGKGIFLSNTHQMVKNWPVMQDTWVLSPLWEAPRRENGYRLQYSCLENSMYRGDWWGHKKLDTHTFTFTILFMPFCKMKGLELIDFKPNAKAFDSVDHNKLWKILQWVEIPECLTCLLRNLCAGQEPTARTSHGAIDWFQIRRGGGQGGVLSSCLCKSTSWEVLGWMKHKLESRLPGEISTTSDMQMKQR